jgi:hypothetical protein
MDAAVIAALIGAGAKLTPSIFNRAVNLLGGNKEFSEGDYYEHLRPFISDHCYIALKVAEDGQNHMLQDFISAIYQDNTERLIGDPIFMQEFVYRVRFLIALQLLNTGSSGEFRITDAGRKFMSLARRRNDYVAAERSNIKRFDGGISVGAGVQTQRNYAIEIQRMLSTLHEFHLNNPDKTWMTLKTLAKKGGLPEATALELLRTVPEIEFGITRNTRETLVKLTSQFHN